MNVDEFTAFLEMRPKEERIAQNFRELLNRAFAVQRSGFYAYHEIAMPWIASSLSLLVMTREKTRTHPRRENVYAYPPPRSEAPRGG